jgi:MHS family citrate/tricarballylate:H+ symporter-like MFS transporter
MKPVLLNRRHVAAAVAGNALEFFDFTAYSFFAVQIGDTFFPGRTPFDTLILSLITFGVGFVGRPIGAIVIGAYGDRAGRRPAMLLSFMLMCIGVFGLAVTPSYAQIGVAAPILVLASRLVQGFALGGEVGPTTAFLIEAAPPLRRGFFGTWQYASQNLANLTAGLIGLGLASSMSASSLDSWGWRIPFLMGAATLPLGWRLRSGLPETLEHGERHRPRTATESAEYRRAIALAVPMLFSTTIAFAMFNYVTTYALAILHMEQRAAFGAAMAWGVCGFIFTLAGGLLSDRFGRKPLMIWSRAGFLVLILPGFLWIDAARSAPVLIGVTAMLAALSSLGAGVSLVCLTEAIPKSVRSASLAIVYAVSIAIFNGTAQLLVTWLIRRTGDVLWPAYYMTLATLVGLVVMSMMRETAPRRLTRSVGNRAA